MNNTELSKEIRDNLNNLSNNISTIESNNRQTVEKMKNEKEELNEKLLVLEKRGRYCKECGEFQSVQDNAWDGIMRKFNGDEKL